MRKFLVLPLFLILFLIAGNLSAYELEFRMGPIKGLNNISGKQTQFKLGINFAGTSKAQESGFYTSTSIDLSVLKDTTIIWLTPEFQYDFKIGDLPLYLYPKMGVVLNFAWYPGNTKGIGFGIKPGFGAKWDFAEWLFVWVEPFGLDVIFAQYQFRDILDNGWVTEASLIYEAMFGVGFRL